MATTEELSSTSSYEEDDLRVTRSLSEAARFDLMLSKLNNLAKGQKSMRKKLKKLDDIEDKLSGLRTDHDTLAARFTNKEAELVNLNLKVNEISSVKEQYQEAIKKTQISQVASEYSSKRFNIIIRNYPQDETNAWESKEDSVKICRKVLKTVLRIPRADSIGIADAHRLYASKGRRPIILKLQTLVDKNKIWDCIANIKVYNEQQTISEKLKIDMVHLPEKLSRDKADLWSEYWEEKRHGHKPKWWFDVKAGQYCFKVNKNVFRPAHDNFLPKQMMVLTAPEAAV